MPRSVYCAVLAAFVCGCSAVSSFTRPEGNGGWSQQRRSEERAAAAAKFTPPPEAPRAATPRAQGAPAPEAQGVQKIPRVLSLADALAMADRYNRTIAIAERTTDMAAEDVGVARSALLPKTTVQAGYTWYTDPLTNSVTLPPDLGLASPVVTVREEHFGTVSAAMRLALDISGELRHGLDAAQASYRAEEARTWATTLSEQRSVVQAYLGLLQAERLNDVTKQTVAVYERQLSDAQSQFDQGRLTKNGVLVVQVALSNAHQRLLRGDVGIARMRRALNKVVGLPVDAATEIADVPGRPVLPDVEDAVSEANRSSPVLGALLEEAQAIDERTTALTRARFPRVAVTAGYDASSAEIVQPQSYASAGVGLQWDLGSDLGRESEIAKLHQAAKRSRVLLDRSARDVEEMVRGAYDAALERLAAVDASEVATRQAEENLRIRREQFAVGRATSEDVLDASVMLSRERAGLATARYQAHARRAELQQLMGRPLEDLASPAQQSQASQNQRPPR